MKLLFLICLVFVGRNVQAQSITLSELDERLTNLEIDKLTNKVKFGMELKNIWGSFQTKNDNLSSNNLPSDYNSSFGAFIFRLKMSGSINDNFKIYAGAQILDIYNGDIGTSDVPSFERTDDFAGNKFMIYKAYADARISENFVFSAGRLPTTYGPPHHIHDKVAREGTYPLTAYSLPIDGVALTWDITKNLTSRTIVSRGKGSNGRTSLWKPYSSPASPGSIAKHSDAVTQMFDVTLNENSYWERFNYIFQFTNVRLQAPEDFSTVTYSSALGGYQTLYLYSQGDYFLKSQILTNYFEIEKPFGLPIVNYLSYTKTWSEATAKLCTVLTESDTLASCTRYFFPDNAPKQDGDRLLFGTRYDFTSTYSLGVEYLYGSRYAVPLGLYADNIFNLNYLNGNAYHLYLNKDIISQNVNLRIGVIHMNLNSSLNSSTQFEDVDTKINNVYATFNIRL